MITCKLFLMIFIMNMGNIIYGLISASTDVVAKIEEAYIVPDIIPVAPEEPLSVIYRDAVDVNFGNELTPTLVKDEPKVKWKVEPKTYYTLMMIDPDVPRQDHLPEYREWVHWVVVNIPENYFSKGEVLVEYVGAKPSHGSGLHRFVFLLFKQQNNKTVFTEPHLNNQFDYLRQTAVFAVHKFVKRNQLGNPVAGNYFLAEYDDYVSVLDKQLHV